MNASAFDVVLFDLGGVLADFGGVATMGQLADIDDDDELWRRWLTSDWVRRFERGACSPEAFAVGMVEEWGLPIDATAYLVSFRDALGTVLPGAAELVEAAAEQVTVGCLSNTNQTHWTDRASRWPLMELFDYRFLSFELGLLKPDRDIFEHAVKSVGVPASRILFLDDNVLNVDGAAEVGLSSVCVRGVEEAKRVLTAANVL